MNYYCENRLRIVFATFGSWLFSRLFCVFAYRNEKPLDSCTAQLGLALGRLQCLIPDKNQALVDPHCGEENIR